jgi:hypothetical protein
VTGGGQIGSEKESVRATFGFTIHFSSGDSVPKGNLVYQDHTSNLRFKATSFDRLVIDGNHAWFTGTGELEDGKTVRFNVKIEVSPDTFSISIPALNGYEAGGALTGGNLTIHK